MNEIQLEQLIRERDSAMRRAYQAEDDNVKVSDERDAAIQRADKAEAEVKDLRENVVPSLVVGGERWSAAIEENRRLYRVVHQFKDALFAYRLEADLALTNLEGALEAAAKELDPTADDLAEQSDELDHRHGPGM